MEHVIDDQGKHALMIRPGGEADLPAINELYNHYVRETHITFDLVPKTMAERMGWFRTFATTGRYRLLVAVEDDEVLGYASSRPYAQKAAYETSVETSIYLRPDVTGRGLGARLHADLLLILEDEDVHRAYAGIAIPNPASIALHERLGFAQVAYFSEQGRKLGRYWDVAWYQRPLGSHEGGIEASDSTR